MYDDDDHLLTLTCVIMTWAEPHTISHKLAHDQPNHVSHPGMLLTSPFRLLSCCEERMHGCVCVGALEAAMHVQESMYVCARMHACTHVLSQHARTTTEH